MRQLERRLPPPAAGGVPAARSRAAAPLRIGILSYRSDPRVGGQGVYVDYLSRALADAGHAVTVLSGPPYPQLDPRVRLVEVPSLDLYAQPHHGHYALRPRHLLSATDTYEYFGHLSGKFVEPYTFGQRAFAYLEHHAAAFDVLLDNQGLASGILEASRRFKLPLVTMIHHPITEDRRLALDAAAGWKQRLLIRRWYAFHHMQIRTARELERIVSPSESARAHVATEFGIDPGRITAIPLGVDQSAFRPDPSVVRVPNRIVTTASADVPLKGLPVLIDAYAALLERYPMLELRVIGQLRRGRTAERIKALGLTDRIVFKAGLGRAELAREFQSATLLVSPSLYEGFGLPAAEAMSCGTPVIVTDGGALPEVAGAAGLIVPRGNAAALADGIDQLLADPARRAEVAAACLERARRCFNWTTIAPRYIELFEASMAASC
ncbi:MAG: glycosyltransferase family 4 protein [Pseudomonadota bacterium]